jgi:hypothetical protein
VNQFPEPAVLDVRRARNYRFFFKFAARVDFVFGIWALFFPASILDLFQVGQSGYETWLRVLGFVDVLLAIGFWYSARRLHKAFPYIAIGLAVKVIAPIGWALAVTGDQLTGRTLTLVIFDGVVWWIPFALFLLEGTEMAARLRGLAPYLCALLNLIAAGALAVVLRPGTEVEPDIAARIAYITNNEQLWQAGWVCWIAAALSLLGFYAWWGTRLRTWVDDDGAMHWGTVALGIASVGLVFDLTAESLLIAWLPKDYNAVAPAASVLTGGIGNGLYTIAGAVLTLATPGLKGWFLVWTWAIWVAGFGLSIFTFAGNFIGVGVCSALLFILFCPWAVVMGRKLA